MLSEHELFPEDQDELFRLKTIDEDFVLPIAEMNLFSRFPEDGVMKSISSVFVNLEKSLMRRFRTYIVSPPNLNDYHKIYKDKMNEATMLEYSLKKIRYHNKCVKLINEQDEGH